MEKNSIDNLPNYIKAARELAILGGYQKSLEIYKKIFYLIQSRMDEISNDNYLLDKWKETTEKLKKECALILSAYQNCKIFQIDVEEDNKKKIEEEKYINNFMMRDNKRLNKPEITKVNDNPKRWEHFGGKAPFSYLKQKSEDNIGKNFSNNLNNISNNENYLVNERYNKNDNVNYLNDFYDDPDVWTSPEEDPRFSYQKNSNKKNNYPSPLTKKRRSVKAIDQKCDLGVVNEENVERRRQNYDRPWQNTNTNSTIKNKENKKTNNQNQNLKQRRKTLPNKDLNVKDKKKNTNNNNNNNINKQPPKSQFLINRYPEDEGNGPDTELIEMIEREVVDMNPNVNFDDIAELETAKRALTEAVVLPLLMPDFFVGLRRPWKGVLLYGPPGTGKTLLAKALATQGKTTFFNVSPTTFASKWKGESEKLVRILFEMARFYAPSTIFIDEVDSVGVKRSDKENEASKKVLAEMLVQMDGISENNNCLSENGKNEQKFVMVLGATNLPWDLDDALRRRFEKRIYIPLPNSVGRMQMFYINFKGIKLSNDVDIELLVKKTEGYSGHDISSVCREASLMNMRRKLMSTNGQFDILEAASNENFLQDLEAPVSQSDLLLAIKNISKSVSSNDVKKFEEWTEQYSSK